MVFPYSFFNVSVLSDQERFVRQSAPHVVAALGDRPARGLTVASPSGFARLIEATGTQNENEPFDLELFNRLSIETGDEILGKPGELP